MAEAIRRPRVGGLEIGLLAPDTPGTDKQISRPRILEAIVALVTVDPRRVAVFVWSSYDHCVDRDGHRLAKKVRRGAVGGLQIRLLAPDTAGTHKHISRSSICVAVVALVAVDTRRFAGFARGSYDHRVA